MSLARLPFLGLAFALLLAACGSSHGRLDAGPGSDADVPDGDVTDDLGLDGGPSDMGSLGAACRVNGVDYPSGSADVPEPFSTCNTCTCENGELVGCTEGICPALCNAATNPGRACVQCGPADECLVVEHTCFPVCGETADCAGQDGLPFCDQDQLICIPTPCG
ncbi:MAG: hypothetical protein ACFCGT_21120 [Sandaracinaceae bacterium]